MDYDIQICYRKGSDNVVPDALSRQGWPEKISLTCKAAVNPQTSSISFEDPFSSQLGGSVVEDPTD